MPSSKRVGQFEELPLALTVAEAAELIRVSPSTVYELIHRYRATGGAEGLPAHRLGRCLRVPRVVVFRILGIESGGAGPGGDRGGDLGPSDRRATGIGCDNGGECPSGPA